MSSRDPRLGSMEVVEFMMVAGATLLRQREEFVAFA